MRFVGMVFYFAVAAVAAGQEIVEYPLSTESSGVEAAGLTVGPDSNIRFGENAAAPRMHEFIGGCSVNGYYWVFAGGMTNVGVEWKVTRSQTNPVKDYSNPAGTAFLPVQDTAAFPCS